MAGHGMRGIERQERRIDAIADAGNAVGTAGMESAARWESPASTQVADWRCIVRDRTCDASTNTHYKNTQCEMHLSLKLGRGLQEHQSSQADCGAI